MSKRLREHIRSNVIGYLALFVALSGTAYAVDGPLPGQNQVGSLDIIDEEVQNTDLGPNSVSGSKVFPSTLNGSDVAPSGLTGSDIATDSLTGSDIGPGAVGTAEHAASIPAARVARTTTAQGIPAAASTRVNFTSERYDTAGLHSNTSNLSRLTAPVTGIYEVTADVSWDLNSSGARTVSLDQSTGTELALEHLNASAAPSVDQNLSTVARFTAGQFVEVFVVQTGSGGTRSVTAEATMTWLAPG